MQTEFKNSNLEVLLSEEQIRAKVKEIGAEITRDYAGKHLLVVGVLKGSCMFLSDLIRAIDLPLEVDFMAVSSYGKATTSSGDVQILKDLGESIRDKDVLVVEDIVDTGLTLSYLLDNLGSRGVRSIKLCALLDKPEPRIKKDLKIDYCGFQIENKFVVGFGLDAGERYRNVPYIAILKNP